MWLPSQKERETERDRGERERERDSGKVPGHTFKLRGLIYKWNGKFQFVTENDNQQSIIK